MVFPVYHFFLSVQTPIRGLVKIEENKHENAKLSLNLMTVYQM